MGTPLNPSAPVFDGHGVSSPTPDPANMQLPDLIKWAVPHGLADYLERIFNHPHTEISDALMQLDFKLLQEIRLSLMDQLKVIFPQTDGLKLRNRKITRTIVGDIYYISFSVVNRSLSKELDKITTKAIIEDSEDDDASDDDDQANSQNDLYATVTRLSKCLSDMKKELKECRKANLHLTDRVGELLLKIEAIEESCEPQMEKGAAENNDMRCSPHSPISIPPPPPTAVSVTETQDEPVAVNKAHINKKKRKKSKKRRQQQSQQAAQNSARSPH